LAPLASLTQAIARIARARSTDEVAETIRVTGRALIGSEGIAVILKDGNLCYYVEEDAIGGLAFNGAKACYPPQGKPTVFRVFRGLKSRLSSHSNIFGQVGAAATLTVPLLLRQVDKATCAVVMPVLRPRCWRYNGSHQRKSCARAK